MILVPCTAVLFDSDGVLVDSDASVVRAYTAWAHARGLDPETVVEMAHGRRSEETVALLVDEPGRAAALAELDALELNDAAWVTALPGARELVASIPAGQWTIVTSAVRELAHARLAAAGIPVPPTLVTADDVTAGKPHPEGYRAAAAALGVDPGVAVVVEDSPAGIRAARAAGVGGVIGVGERAHQADADLVVADLGSLHWNGDGLVVGPRD